MRPHLPILLLVILSCGPQMATLPPGEPIQKHPVPKRAPDLRPYENAALELFLRSDYVRALRATYRAADLLPDAPGPVLLRGLIYERGLDRPDLALLEYDRILRKLPRRRALIPLRPRLLHLYRRARQQSAAAALSPEAPPPLQGQPLAFFPFQTWQRGKSQAALAFGLTDLLMFYLCQDPSTAGFNALQHHVLATAFQRAFPQADAAAFARWAGAEHTLSGTVVKQSGHRIALSLILLDRRGDVRYHLPALSGRIDDLSALVSAALAALAAPLHSDLQPDSARVPNISPLALNLLARGLDAYLMEDAKTAYDLLQSARDLEPGSTLIQQRYTWARADWLAAQPKSDPIVIYRRFSTQPIPSVAAARRLQATQNALTPPPGEETGIEPSSPYTPPQPESVP